MTIIDGRHTADTIKAEIAAEVAAYASRGIRPPYLAAVLAGHDGGSETYVANKIRACESCGFRSSVFRLEESTPQSELLALIGVLNNDPQIDGFIVQLPLPRHIDTHAVINAIDPAKDVDGFTAENVGRMTLGLPCYRPATPAGIIELLLRYDIPVKGRDCVIVGRSDIVGKPLGIMMMQRGMDATVTVCHSHTADLARITRRADILVAAIGQPSFITADMVADGATVIDVGTTRVPDASRKSGFRLAGDVDFAGVAPRCSFITPVPGGVGPMTIAMLMLNTLQAYKSHM